MILVSRSLTLVIMVCLWVSSSAQIVFDGRPIPYFGDKVEVLSTESELTPKEVLFHSGLVQSEAEVLNLGVSHLNHWLRFEVINQSDYPKLRLFIDYPVIDELDVFMFNEGLENTLSLATGEARPFDSRGNTFKDFVIDLPIEKGQKATILIRAQTGEQLMLPLKLVTYEEVVQSNLLQNGVFGIYAGIIIVMFLYNLFLSISIRDRSYFLYVAYILTIGFTQFTLQGYAFPALWPEWPELAVRATNLVGVLSGIAVLSFAREFLKIRSQWKWADNIVLGFILLDFVAFVLTVIGRLNVAYNIINAVAAIGSAFLLVIAIVMAIRGKRTARFFVVAWSIFLVSVVFYVLKDIGVVAYNEFTTSSLMAGSAIEIVLLSFALADRINVLKMENEISQKRELEATREKEKLVSEQNILLEQKVNERTSELREANSQLNKAMDDLKQTQVQLVNAEKMASLGQLTAGIAHEINNPINFVAASITPLKRDLNDLQELLREYENALNSDDLNAGREKVQQLKQEIDFDFTVQEIDELLRGVDEGAKRTAEIVQGLKNFSRLDESDSKFADIHECLDSTLIVFRNLLKDQVDVDKQYSPDVGEIECFPGKLNQLFSNIIVNAVQAMSKTLNPRIIIKSEDLGEKIRITLADNGPGIPDEIKTRIFEPFFTTKEVGEGTGLGLSIVYSIVEQHHGELTVDSKVGDGTSFIFTLPKKLD